MVLTPILPGVIDQLVTRGPHIVATFTPLQINIDPARLEDEFPPKLGVSQGLSEFTRVYFG